MIEIVAVVGLSLFASILGVWAWGQVRGPAKNRHLFGLRLLVTIAIVLPAIGYSLYRISKSRTYQFFGEIVPRVEVLQPVVALTFDDGPAPGITDRILSILHEEDVRATFFLNGHSIEEYPAEAEKIILAGHEVGNHSYSHAQLIGKTLAFVGREIESTDALIRQAGYLEEIHFRSPYGKKLLVLPFYLWRGGRKNIFWDIEPDSYSEVTASADRIVAHVVERVRPGSIILLHVMYQSRATSLEAVPGIIRELREQGFRFVTVSELLEQTQASGFFEN